jgi:hypothetical protein
MQVEDNCITIGFDCQFKVKLKDSLLTTLVGAFKSLVEQLFSEFMRNALLGFAEYYMSLRVKPFSCEKCSNDSEFIWKTRHGKETKILAIYYWASLHQLQVQCKRCKHKFSLTRKLLGIEPMKRIPPETYRRLGLIGSLTSYRVAEKIVGMFGWAIDKMTIWKCVQKTAGEIEFGLDPNGLAHGEADGTGVPIKGIKKRGKEMRFFVQLKRFGGIRVAGVDIGNYNSDWKELFKGSIKVMKQFKSFLLVTDGDTNIFNSIKTKVNVLFQRCLWHIPHQLKYTLWKDEVKRKSNDWKKILAEVMEISAIRSLVDDDKVIEAMVQSKKERLETVISLCEKNGYNHSAEYLKNAERDMFTAISNRLNGKTTSRVERLIRTVNTRANVGKWSTQGVLNVTKIRLAYYYNGFDA